MRLRYLETFIVVAEEQHFGRAAVRMRVAQPAVSQTIRALEDELGVELFDRSKRRVKLTHAGEVYLDEAQAILMRLERASERARQAASGQWGRLIVGFTAVCAISDVARSITRFIRDMPDVEVRLHQMGTREQGQALKLGRIDVGFSVMPDSDPELETKLVVPDRLHAFIPATHPLAALEQIPLAMALAEPVLLMTRASEPAIHRAFTHLCHVHDITPQVAAEVDQLDTMLAFVAAGLGVSFAPSVAGRLKLDGVVSRPLSPEIEAGVTALWAPARVPPTAKHLIQRLELEGEGMLWD